MNIGFTIAGIALYMISNFLYEKNKKDKENE